MTTSSPPQRLRWCAAVLPAAVLAAAAAGCAVTGSPSPHPAPHRSATAGPSHTPAPVGTGPYADPGTPSPAAPLPVRLPAVPKGGIRTPRQVKQTDATAVSKAGLQVMWTYDTSTDSSPYDASVRAARAGWCTTAYARQLLSAPPRMAPGAQWSVWAGHHAYTTVSLRETEDAGRPPDTATRALREWTIAAVPRGRDGWKGAALTVVVFAELDRPAAGDPWRLAAVTVQ